MNLLDFLRERYDGEYDVIRASLRRHSGSEAITYLLNDQKAALDKRVSTLKILTSTLEHGRVPSFVAHLVAYDLAKPYGTHPDFHPLWLEEGGHDQQDFSTGPLGEETTYYEHGSEEPTDTPWKYGY